MAMSFSYFLLMAVATREIFFVKLMGATPMRLPVDFHEFILASYIPCQQTRRWTFSADEIGGQLLSRFSRKIVKRSKKAASFELQLYLAQGGHFRYLSGLKLN